MLQVLLWFGFQVFFLLLFFPFYFFLAASDCGRRGLCICTNTDRYRWLNTCPSSQSNGERDRTNNRGSRDELSATERGMKKPMVSLHLAESGKLLRCVQSGGRRGRGEGRCSLSYAIICSVMLYYDESTYLTYSRWRGGGNP
ncbi:hypothetical protein F5X96DRAFT_646848 [Biscogniauxia mediterranea]|nr:hypothetical protein F5X96DRAFT_646848 [Biscogniauxia mediterranea]